MITPRLTRRSALLGLAGAFTLGRASLALAAGPGQRRFVVVILRGAMDGMAAVTPYGDPALAGLRGALLPGEPGREGGVLDLGGFYGLHPALSGMAGLYAAGELLAVHAVAGPSRTRSHFEAQDYLESGADHLVRQGGMTSGWLNRVVAVLPPASGGSAEALSVGISMPLLLRGPAAVGSWAPELGGQPQPELYARLAALSAGDRVVGPAVAQGLRERGFAEATLRVAMAQPAGATQDPGGAGARRGGAGDFPVLAATAGQLLAAADGPRIAALELGGWDTHEGQSGRLRAPLRQLDTGLVALREGLGPAWRQTVVLAMTEFGRTARVNGTGGTDHGTGTVAFVAGGAVAGGRVLGDWPGLGQGRLLEDRDLQPTTDLRGMAKGLLAGHLGLGTGALEVVFPGSGAAGTMSGLIRA